MQGKRRAPKLHALLPQLPWPPPCARSVAAGGHRAASGAPPRRLRPAAPAHGGGGGRPPPDAARRRRLQVGAARRCSLAASPFLARFWHVLLAQSRRVWAPSSAPRHLFIAFALGVALLPFLSTLPAPTKPTNQHKQLFNHPPTDPLRSWLHDINLYTATTPIPPL
jgi:hypothetical protein